MQNNHRPAIAALVFAVLILTSIVISVFFKKEIDITPDDRGDIITRSVDVTPIAHTQFDITPTPTVDPFEVSVGTLHSSNVIGYLGSGSFIVDLPGWVVEHWIIDNQDETTFAFTPRNDDGPREYSDIVVYISTSTEEFNASQMYDDDRYDEATINTLRIAEVLLNKAGDMRIYYIERRSGEQISFRFYIDGNGKTAVIKFSAPERNYAKYAPKIREFIQGLGKGGAPQG